MSSPLHRIGIWARRRWRRRDAYRRAVILGALSAAALLALTAVAIGSPWFEARPVSAAWFQAIGAIVALAIAIAAPVWQSEEAERRARIAELRAAINLAEKARDLLSQVDERFRDAEHAAELARRRYYHARLRHLSAIVDQVNVSQLGELSSVSYFINVGGALAAVCAIIVRFEECKSSTDVSGLYQEAGADVRMYASLGATECGQFIKDVNRQLRTLRHPLA